MKEHAIGTKFTLNAKDGKFKVGVKKADPARTCAGCMFHYKYYNYSLGYGFLADGCRLVTMRNAMCMAEARTDKTSIIYVNLGKVTEQ